MRKLALLFAFAVVTGGCATVQPAPLDSPRIEGSFSHEIFDRVLRTYVDDRGRVDYKTLARNPAELDKYYSTLAQISPDSHPEAFADDAERLTYWINAYNASVMKAVIDAYPIDEVGDVGIAFWKIGFFMQQKIVLGGDSMSLYYLENAIVRDRFRDARIHFALNCASASCPRLPNRAFLPPSLERRLDEESRLFINDPRNVTIDHERRTVRLSSIFDWYDGDFTDWPAEGLGEDASLVDYVAIYADSELSAELNGAADYDVEFIPYDWSLNDQAASPSP